MARRRGSKKRICGVVGCDEKAKRSVSFRKAQKVLDADLADARRAHLCKEHYKEFKKATKVDRTLERIHW